MYYNGFITYKNKASNSSDLKLIMTAPPLITHSEIKHDTFVIPGRDSELFSKDTYRGNASVKVSFDLHTSLSGESDIYNYNSYLNAVLIWLSGSGNLIISDEPSSYYEVKKVIISTDQRDIVNYGHIEAEFIVYPYKFYQSGDDIKSSGTITNTYDKSMPVYHITASTTGGTVTLTVNNYNMVINVPSDSNKIYVDTRRQIAFDGNNHNVVVTGDYKKLYLQPNVQTSIGLSGGVVGIQPKWGNVI